MSYGLWRRKAASLIEISPCPRPHLCTLCQGTDRRLFTGEDYLNSTAAAILRANLLKHDLVQRQSSAGGGGGGGGGGTNAPTALASNGPAGRAGHHFGPEKGSRHFHPLGAGS